MIRQKGDPLREMQLAFIGKLMAGLSHEFKNHLAIIKELSGLLEDLLLLEESPQAAGRERYEKIFSGISERIAQAAEMCRFFSGFSHRMDQPLSSFSVTDVLQEKIYLIGRFARQKQVELIFSCDTGLPPIFNNPSLLQFAVFCIAWPALQGLEQGGRVIITARQEDESVEIVMQLEGAMKAAESEPSWGAVLPDILQMLEAGFSHKTDPKGNKEIIVTLSSIDSPGRSDKG
jgi:nitrogen-specific signal transduction histidine kinase